MSVHPDFALEGGFAFTMWVFCKLFVSTKADGGGGGQRFSKHPAGLRPLLVRHWSDVWNHPAAWENALARAARMRGRRRRGRPFFGFGFTGDLVLAVTSWPFGFILFLGFLSKSKCFWFEASGILPQICLVMVLEDHLKSSQIHGPLCVCPIHG